MLEKKVPIPRKYIGLTEDIRRYMDHKRDLANEVRKSIPGELMKLTKSHNYRISPAIGLLCLMPILN